MTKVKTEKKWRVNGRLNHSYDNPYLAPANIQLDSFRCQMKDVLNLYLYMSQPDWSHPTVRRPKYLPFLRRNLYYMQDDVTYSFPKGRASLDLASALSSITTFQNFCRQKSSASPTFGGAEMFKSGANAADINDPPYSLMSPSLSFYRIRFNNQITDYDYADVQCFRSREIDGQFSRTEPVDAAHFHMKLNQDQKIDIDLPNFTPDLPEDVQRRADYLLLKVEIRPDGIAVSGGRKLRLVPARQSAQSELKRASDPEHPPTSQPEVKVMFGLKRLTSARLGQQGQLIREGKAQIALISALQLGIDTEDSQWLNDTQLVKRLLKLIRRPTDRQPLLRLEVFVDEATYSTAGSVLSSARTTPDRQQTGNSDNGSTCYQRLRQRLASGLLDSSETPTTNSSSETPRQSAEPLSLFGFSSTSSMIGEEKPVILKERDGILGVVSKRHKEEMIKAEMPERLAWCFRMSDSTFELKPPNNLSDQKSLSSSTYFTLTDPPPADVFRFTDNSCAICNPEYRRPFPTFVSLLYHLCTTHPRLAFKFKKDLVPTPFGQSANTHDQCSFSSNESSMKFEGSSLKKRIKREEADELLDEKPEMRQCPGLIVTLNRAYNGVHELDTSRHYKKWISVLRQGQGIRRIPKAWNRPPIFLVVRNLARFMRAHPPAQTLDELESRTHLNDGTFGGCAQWQDPHFHTREYAQCNAPFVELTQQRRIHDYVDVNENEKRMLSLLSDFHSSFRSSVMTHQAYGANIILVNEEREKLLDPAVYTQFIIHLSNLKRIGRLYKAEFFDIVARLRYGSGYDPRSDPKHYVYATLCRLEQQRPSCMDIQKKNFAGRKVLQSSRNSRECSPSSSTTEDSSSLGRRSTIVTRKRSFDGSNSSGSEKRLRLQPLILQLDGEVEKKRQFNTKTPMDVLTQNARLEPMQVPISCFDDLACRYQFASDKTLRLIWHFCREWTREYLEWH